MIKVDLSNAAIPSLMLSRMTMWMSRVFGLATTARKFFGLGEKTKCVARLLAITLDTADLQDKGMRKVITKEQKELRPLGENTRT